MAERMAGPHSHGHHPGGADAPGEGRRSPLADVDFRQRPFTVAWEITRACALRCVHCRAEAQPRRDPRELTTEEGRDLVDQLVAIGGPILIVTGGDPMMRPDVFDLIEHAAGSGLRVALSPSATARVTRDRLARARDAGVSRAQISLDGGTAATHDAFRGMPGSYARTLEILDDLRTLGMSLQIGYTVTRRNVHERERVAELAAEYDAVMLSVFFLVPVGRGRKDDLLTPDEHEDVYHWMYDLSKRSPFDVRSTAAPQYRRVVIQRRRAEETEAPGGSAPGRGLHLTGAGYSFTDGLGQSLRMKGVNDGNGFAFVSHVGEVCPSGFLELPAGNLREASFAAIYRDSDLFRTLRDAGRIGGKCGACEFLEICGGSRARAYGLTGDMMAADPTCAYEPPARS